jgi:leucyl aminopeptidase
MHPEDTSACAGAETIVFVGVGDDATATTLQAATAGAVACLNTLQLTTAVFEAPSNHTASTVEAITRSAVLSAYQFDKYLTGPSVEAPRLTSVAVEAAAQPSAFSEGTAFNETGRAAEVAAWAVVEEHEAAFTKSKLLAEGTTYARDWANERVSTRTTHRQHGSDRNAHTRTHTHARTHAHTLRFVCTHAHIQLGFSSC